jgi:hypothetical protein
LTTNGTRSTSTGWRRDLIVPARLPSK